MITQSLKALAKELSIPVLALAQLSRQVENREDKKPQLSDLRESGSIEQDADMVMFIYREAYYLSRLEPREGTEEHFKWQEKMDQVRGLAEIIIGKQRHGPIGNVKLSFNEDLTKFGNLARDAQPLRPALTPRWPSPAARAPDHRPRRAGPQPRGPARARRAGAEVAPVLKADGYGLGAGPVGAAALGRGRAQLLRRPAGRGRGPARRAGPDAARRRSMCSTA